MAQGRAAGGWLSVPDKRQWHKLLLPDQRSPCTTICWGSEQLSGSASVMHKLNALRRAAPSSAEPQGQCSQPALGHRDTVLLSWGQRGTTIADLHDKEGLGSQLHHCRLQHQLKGRKAVTSKPKPSDFCVCNGHSTAERHLALCFTFA